MKLDGLGDVVMAGQAFAAGQPDFAVIKLEGDTGNPIWRTEIGGSGSGADSATSIGVDAAGDVFAGGRLYEADSRGDFVVVKLDGETGDELWRVVIDGAHDGGQDDDGVEALAVDGNGDAIAVGRIFDTSFSDFFVIKLDGDSGAEVWRQEISGSFGTSRDVARAVAIDSAGDVVVAGHLFSPGYGLAVVKLDGSGGSELWRRGLSGLTSTAETAWAVVVDGADDVVVGGQRNTNLQLDFAVYKLDGSSGDDVWGQVIDGGRSDESASAVTVDANGDVVAVGTLFSESTNWDFAVLKFDGDTGAEGWRRLFGGTLEADFEDFEEATAVVTDGQSDVFAVGFVDNAYWRLNLAAIKLEGESGDTIWRHELRGYPFFGHPVAAVVDADDDLVAVSGLGSTPALEFEGRRGSIRALPGPSLVAKDPGDLAKRSFRAVLQSEHVVSPEPGSFADPRIVGATVRIVNPTTLEEAIFALPAGPEWAGLGNPPGSTGYTYRAITSAGPCTRVQVRAGKRIQVQCSARSAPIPFTLDEAAQGSLAVSLQIGHAGAQCAVFGGTVKTDAPGKFQAKKAPEQPSCP